MKKIPEFPITVKFDDGDIWEFENIDELACTLEWFDSEDPEEGAVVVDKKNRRVCVKVVELNVINFELKSTDEISMDDAESET